MVTSVQLPPQGLPVIDQKTGLMNPLWYRFIAKFVGINLTGDVSSVDGVTTIGAGKVTNAMLAGSIASSKLVGTDIATVGTITSGTWHGTAIANSYIANTAVANLSGTNTGDQTITLTGDVTGSGTGSFATSIGAGKVTNAMLAGSIASSKLVGTDIATVGTITSGTWNGSPIGNSYLSTTLAYGTYTPTITDLLNMTSHTVFDLQYMRVGSVVTVSGRVTVHPTAAGDTQIGISTPINSAFTNSQQAGGVGCIPVLANHVGAIYADSTVANRVRLEWQTTDTSGRDMFFSFTYLII